MGDFRGPDLISDLPQSIIESILVRLPIRDAVRTSILSSKWRYKWNSITKIVVDEKCVPPSNDRTINEKSLLKFVNQLLFLHQGPIHKFQIINSYLQSCPEIDQWILFLSRNDLKELLLELGEGEWFRIPSCLFNCQKLIRLELFRCELEPPLTFKGFMCLKTLILHQVLISPEAIESLISSCPLLESLSLSYFDSLALTIHSPKLRYLYLEGEFRDLCLEDTPLLVDISVAMYMTDDIAEHFEQISSCNFTRFLGGVPNLERLAGHIYFTKVTVFFFFNLFVEFVQVHFAWSFSHEGEFQCSYGQNLFLIAFSTFLKYLSIGNDPGKLPVTYHNLETVELYQVSFEDMKEILVVLRLITSCPNLKELQISGSTNIPTATDAPDLDFWSKECPSDCTLKQLKVVKLTDMCGVPHEMELIKFLLANSPLLETMSIVPCMYVMESQLKMLIELVRFRRASARAEIVFVRD